MLKCEYRKEIEGNKFSLSEITGEKIVELLDLDNIEKTTIDFDFILTHLNKTVRVPEWKEEKNPLAPQIIDYLEIEMRLNALKKEK